MIAPILLLHGFTGAPESWDEVTALLPGGNRHMCETLLGHGDAPLDLASTFVEELDRLAGRLRARETSRVCLVGYSLGARVALGLLARHPELFGSALLIGLNPGLSSESSRAERALEDERWARLLEGHGIEAFVAAWERQPLFESQASLTPARLDRQRAVRLERRPEGLARALRVLGLARMPDHWPLLPRIDTPIRLLTGEADLAFQGLAEALRADLPRASLSLARGAGHNVPLEQPRAVAAAIMEVIAS